MTPAAKRCLTALAAAGLVLAAFTGARAEADPEQLKALDLAYRNGILTRDEYEAKKRALAQPAAKPSPAAPRNAAGATGTGYQRMRLVRVMDAQGWGQPVEALRLLVPSDWRTEGGVNWVSDPGCPSNIIQLRFRATAPDGVTGIEFLPAYTWAAADDPSMQQILARNAQSRSGCNPGPAVGAVDFLRGMLVPRLRPDARIVGAEPLPSATRELQKGFAAMNQQFAAAGLETMRTGDVGRVRLTVRSGNGEAEESITASVVANISMGLDTAAAMQGNYGAKSRNYQLTAQDIWVARAPRGQLDGRAPLFAQMLGTIQVNPQYVAAVSQFYAAIGRINAQANADRARIWRDAQAHIEKTRQETAAYRSQVQERIQEQFGQVIRGVDSYVDPRSNERVELSAGYRNAWSNGKGEYILSDSVNFDPRVTLQEDWTQMRREHDR